MCDNVHIEITQEQYDRIEKYLPRQRGNVSMTNLQLINAILYVTENGCKWRALPKSYGNWHTIYVRMNRWSKNGVLQRLFEALQVEDIIRIKVEAVCLDSTSVKVHPDGTGALKKYEGDNMRSKAMEKGYSPVVPPKSNRKDPWEYDRERYKQRNEIERYFLRLKRFRRIFTRYDKLDVLFCGFIHFAMIVDAI